MHCLGFFTILLYHSWRKHSGVEETPKWQVREYCSRIVGSMRFRLTATRIVEAKEVPVHVMAVLRCSRSISVISCQLYVVMGIHVSSRIIVCHSRTKQTGKRPPSETSQLGRGGCDGFCSRTIVLHFLRQTGHIHERRRVRKSISDVD